MPAPPLSDDELLKMVAIYRANGSKCSIAAAQAADMPLPTFKSRINSAAARGLLGYTPVLEGFVIKSTSEQQGPDGELRGRSIKQVREPGEEFEVPAGHIVKGVSALLDPDGRELAKWVKTTADSAYVAEALRAVVAALKDDLPRIDPVSPPKNGNSNLLNQYTVTDLHFGMLSWKEETGSDYDLKIAEQLLLDWFAAAIRQSPDASTAILCQLGDLLHHDSHDSVTPAHRNVLDADSRLQKMIRVVIRTLRRIVAMLLEKHEHLHFIISDANHDPAGGAWLRELFAAFYENEPRVTVDTSPSTYNMFEFGETSLFYHHGHKRKIATVDSVFAGKFRETYGRTKFSYAHMGHLHSDEVKSTNLMKVERHETLASPDAYAANGGWLSGRSAKVITYHKQFGEVGRITLTPEMVAGAAA